jgi:hypothetical protein
VNLSLLLGPTESNALGFRLFFFPGALSEDQRKDLQRAHEMIKESTHVLSEPERDALVCEVNALRLRLHTWLTPYEGNMGDRSYFPDGLDGFYNI